MTPEDDGTDTAEKGSPDDGPGGIDETDGEVGYDDAEDTDQDDLYLNEYHAFHELKADIERKFGLHVSFQNTVISIIGVLLAFSSVVFVWSLGYGVDVFVKYLFGASCVLGVMAVTVWALRDIPMGANIESLIKKYNSGDHEHYDEYVTNSLLESLRLIRKTIAVLRIIIIIMIALLATGFIIIAMKGGI